MQRPPLSHETITRLFRVWRTASGNRPPRTKDQRTPDLPGVSGAWRGLRDDCTPCCARKPGHLFFSVGLRFPQALGPRMDFDFWFHFRYLRGFGVMPSEWRWPRSGCERSSRCGDPKLPERGWGRWSPEPCPGVCVIVARRWFRALLSVTSSLWSVSARACMRVSVCVTSPGMPRLVYDRAGGPVSTQSTVTKGVWCCDRVILWQLSCNRL